MQPGVAPLPHSGRRFSVSTREASSNPPPGSGSFLQQSDTLLAAGCAPPPPLTTSPTGPGFARPGLGARTGTARAITAQRPPRRPDAPAHTARGGGRGPAPALAAHRSPSGRCPARSRRTPHSWRGRRARRP